MNFPSQMFFNDINHDYRAAICEEKSFAATSCYYEKVRRTMRSAIESYFLKPAFYLIILILFLVLIKLWVFSSNSWLVINLLTREKIFKGQAFLLSP